MSHLFLVVLVLLVAPQPFADQQTQTVEVELVPPDKAPAVPEEKAPEEKPETKTESIMQSAKPDKSKQAEWQPQLDPWAQNKQDQQKSQQEKPEQAKQDQQKPAGQPDAKPNQNQQQANKPNQNQSAQQQPSQQQRPQSPQKGPAPGQQQAQAQPTPPPEQQPPPDQQKPPETSIFDPVNITKFMNIASGGDSGFDAAASVAANISSDDRTAFKAHLRKCWKLPASVTSQARVVLRVALRRDGHLAGEPMLIEASASRDGPVVMQTAMKALKECAPFGFLPPNKYSEWKVLDLSFTPQDMAGG